MTTRELVAIRAIFRRIMRGRHKLTTLDKWLASARAIVISSEQEMLVDIWESEEAHEVRLSRLREAKRLLADADQTVGALILAGDAYTVGNLLRRRSFDVSV